MPLIGSLNFILQFSQSGLLPLNVFFVIIGPHFQSTVGMAGGGQADCHAGRLVFGQQNEREHVSAI